MSIGPISLQNLFLRLDQLNRELAHQAQSEAIQQDGVSQRLRRDQEEYNERVHNIEGNEKEVSGINDDTNSATASEDEQADKDSEKQSASDAATNDNIIHDDSLGQKINISQ